MLIKLNRRQTGYSKIKRRVFEDTKKGFRVWAKHNYDILDLAVDLKTGTLKLIHFNTPVPRNNHNKTPEEIRGDNEFKDFIKNYQKKS